MVDMRAITNKLVFIFVVVLLGCGARSGETTLCRAVTAIANDHKKMEYAKEWVASHLSDPMFLESIRRRNSLEFGDERIREFGGLDWKYLGFAEQLASLEFNLGVTDSGKWDVKRIGSVSLRQGRTFIILRLSSAKDLGLSWPMEELAKLKIVSEGVFVYCGNGK